MKINGFQDTIEWYNQHAEEYAAATVQKIPQEEIDQFTQLLPQGATILDAGCGAGRDTNVFSQKSFHAIGLDISSGLISVVRASYPHCTFIEGSMLAIPFSDSSFDGIWCHASLLHFETQEEVKK